MRLKKLAFVFFLLFSSASFAQESKAPLVDPAFKNYREEFINLSGGLITPDNIAQISIHFKKLEYSEKGEGTIGLCYWGFNAFGKGGTPPRIEIDPSYWEFHSEIQKRALIFHEIGHCGCQREHPNVEVNWLVKLLDKAHISHRRYAINYFEDTCPRTIMHPYDLSSACLTRHKKYYDEEMFKHCTPPLEL